MRRVASGGWRVAVCEWRGARCGPPERPRVGRLGRCAGGPRRRDRACTCVARRLSSSDAHGYRTGGAAQGLKHERVWRSTSMYRIPQLGVAAIGRCRGCPAGGRQSAPEVRHHATRARPAAPSWPRRHSRRRATLDRRRSPRRGREKQRVKGLVSACGAVPDRLARCQPTNASSPAQDGSQMKRSAGWGRRSVWRASPEG